MGRKDKGDVNMKALVVYYSRTGKTKNIAESIAKKLGADIEEIVDTTPRKGFFGFLFGSRDAMFKKGTSIEPLKSKPEDYDVVVVGTPIWAGTMAPAVRTYLNISKIKKAAFFCTCGGRGIEKTFANMHEIIVDAKVIAGLGFTMKTLKEGAEEKIDKFVEKIKEAK